MTMKPDAATFSLAILAAASCLSASVARAENIVFKPTQDKRELSVVNDVFGQFLKSHPDIRIETALVDLQNNKVASMAIRFNSPETCSGTECDTVVLAYRQKAWQVVFEHSASSLSTESPAEQYPSEGMKTLVVDGYVRWVWSGFDHYLPDISSLGTRFPQPTLANPMVRKNAMAALGELINGYAQAEIMKTDIAVDSSAPIADSFYFVSAYAHGLCGNFVGCPHAIMMPVVGGFKTLWSGFAIGPGAVMSSSHHGLKDIALGTRSGYLVLQFDGTRYQPVETSYPSLITPAP